MRIQISEIIQIVSDDKIYDVEIIDITEDAIKTKILREDIKNYESPLKIHLYQGYLKGDKMDFIIQKAAELGVNEITPLFTKRTIVKLRKEKLSAKVERFKKILEEASKQSKRKIIPNVNMPISLSDMDLNNTFTLVAYEEEEQSIKEILQKQDIRSVNIIIGPEGGFEQEEINYLKEKGAISVSIGNRILRAETAALSLLTILQYEKGDLN